jgi:hypothetical protein
MMRYLEAVDHDLLDHRAIRDWAIEEDWPAHIFPHTIAGEDGDGKDHATDTVATATWSRSDVRRLPFALRRLSQAHL